MLEPNTLRIVNFVLPSISIVLTCFRLYDRAIHRRLWWDDACAAVTMVFAIMFEVIVELFVRYHVVSPERYPQDVKISVYYMCSQFFYLVAWSARISILFTIIRLTALGPLRRLLIVTSGLFGITWLILFAQVWWVCETEPGWKQEPSPQCDLGRNVAIAQVITDVLSDAILIVAPVRLVWRVKLSRAQKIRIIAIFSSTLLTTTVSLYHASWVLRDGGLMEALAAVIQASVSLIVANLNVIVAFIFRISNDEGNKRPAPLVMRSIITFGQMSSRKRNTNANGLTTTFMAGTYDFTVQAPTIHLETFVSTDAKQEEESKNAMGSDIGVNVAEKASIDQKAPQAAIV